MRFLLITVFSLFTSLCIADEVEDLIKQAPGKEAYPQAAALVLFDRQTVTIDKEGNTIRSRERLIKLLDERAKSQYGDQSVPFNADEDTVIITVARTRLPDGKWIEPEKDAFTLTSAPEVQWASAYSQLKQRNVSFPGLDVGAVMHWSYTIRPKPKSAKEKVKEKADAKRAGGIVLFGGYDPILEKTCKIQVADGRAIRYEVQNSAVEPKTSHDDAVKQTTYFWELKNLEQIIQEPNATTLGYLVPRLSWTTFKDWESLGNFVASRFWEKVDSSQAAIEGYLGITAKEIQGKPALMQAAMWVARNIRNVSLSLGRAGYEPNTADRVWQNKYGDPRDKAVLLCALLRAYGYAPQVVLVLNDNVPFSDLPVLEQFSHLIIAVPMEQDTIWIDPTAENYLPGALPYRCTFGMGCTLMDGAPMLLKVPAGSIESRSVRTEIKATLSALGDLSGYAACRPFGGFGARARSVFKDQKQQEQDIFAQRAVSRISQGTKMTEFVFSDPIDLTTNFVTKLGFQSPGYGVRQQDMLLVELPTNPFVFGTTGFYPSLPEVHYPVELPPQSRASTVVELTIPDNFIVSYLPPPLIVENPYLSLVLQPELQGQKLTWTQTLEIKADIVPKADYGMIRDVFERLSLQKNRLAILEEKKARK
jgi:hypothetical protein